MPNGPAACSGSRISARVNNAVRPAAHGSSRLCPAADKHPRAGAQEPPRDASANPPRTAGDEYGLLGWRTLLGLLYVDGRHAPC